MKRIEGCPSTNNIAITSEFVSKDVEIKDTKIINVDDKRIMDDYNRYKNGSNLEGKDLDAGANTSYRFIKNDNATSDNSDNDRFAIGNPIAPNKHDKRVMNLTSIMLNSEEIKILSKGLGFAVSPKNIPFESIICNIENGTQGLLANNREMLRQECSLAMLRSKHPKSNLNKEGREALRSL